MHTLKNKKRTGFIQTIVLIIVALIILGYLNINIKDVLAGPVVQDNLKYAWQLVVDNAGYVKDVLIQNLQKYIPNK